MAAALAAAGGAQAQVVFIPGDDQRRIAAELFPTLPKELGGRPTAGLIHGTRKGRFILYDLSAQAFQRSSNGSVEHIDLGCCRIELPNEEK